MNKSAAILFAILVGLPSSAQDRTATRSLLQTPPPIPANVQQAEQQLLRGIPSARRQAIKSAAHRMSPSLASAADPVAVLRRAADAAFPALSGRDADVNRFLVEVQAIRVLRSNISIAQTRVWGDPHIDDKRRGIRDTPKLTTAGVMSAASEARRLAEADARRKAEEASKAAEAVKRAAGEAEKRAAAEAARKRLLELQAAQERLNAIGDEAQLANVDLQNMLQKQQQTLQMMSNISKMIHDTAMAVIRKIGG